MPRAVIFDMDGLLIDSEPLWVRAERTVFAEFGVHLTEDDCARTKGLRVDDVVAFWHRLYGFAGVSAGEVERHLVAKVVELVRAEGAPLPGVREALTAAAAYPVALASSSPMAIIEATLERLELRGAFAVVQSAENEPFGKPHPAIFLRTAERLEVSALECVVLEDSMNGVIAAKAARMGCIAVPFDHPNHATAFAVADVVLPSLLEVTADVLKRF